MDFCKAWMGVVTLDRSFHWCSRVDDLRIRGGDGFRDLKEEEDGFGVVVAVATSVKVLIWVA